MLSNKTFASILVACALSIPVLAQSPSWKLTLNMLEQRLDSSEKVENTCISPLSLQMAMALTATGTKGQTRSEIVKALGLGGSKKHLTLGKGEVSIKELLDAYQQPESPVCTANAIWINNTFGNGIKSSFLKQCEKGLDAQARSIDYDAKGASTINAWVEEQTKGRIPKIIEKLDPKNGVLTLTNALTFDARWDSPFGVKQTRELPFHCLSGEQNDVPTMYHPFRNANYYKDDQVEHLCLPYQEQGNLRTAMHLFLPNEEVSLKEAVQHIGKLFQKRKGFEYQEMSNVKLYLPKFSMTCSYDLIPDLKALGVERAFMMGNKDFSPIISNVPLQISLVRQSTLLEVTEEGTKAAAATAVGIRIGAAKPVPITWIEMRVDHPFVYVIEDVTHHVPLFVGFVTDLK